MSRIFETYTILISKIKLLTDRVSLISTRMDSSLESKSS
jgi:hypothetical protein